MIFPAIIDKLSDMLSLIKEAADKANFSRIEVKRMELACEEALVNVIKYAYPHQKKGAKLEIECSHPQDSVLHIVIKDQGIPFDPIEFHKKIDIEAPEEEREIGGLGVYMTKRLVDEMHYRRENNTNILTLIKRKGEEEKGK